jgi:aminobenzoyl-glutamate utilization protein B
MSLQHTVQKSLQKHEKDYIDISRQIWDNPELRFEETTSSGILANYLEENNFTVERGIADISTAFSASYGSGGPIIAFLGEFDALSNLSQEAENLEQKAIEEGGNGHGCGHHMLGTGAMAAAIAARDYLVENNLEGTIRFYGCPGEEGGSGKTFMAREGVFDDISLAICWHPWDFTQVWVNETLANYQVAFKFKGVSSHAASSPHLGRSALDAVELMNVGANYLREHIEDSARLHYAVTNTGGVSPNVVQAEAEVLYLMRDLTVEKAGAIYERVKKIAEGAALMTETEVSVRFEKACSNYLRNHVLEEVMKDQLQGINDLSYSEEELDFAGKIQDTLSSDELSHSTSKVTEAYHKAGQDAPHSLAPLVGLVPYSKAVNLLPGSTDVGDVSQIAPTVQCLAACYAFGTQMHTWQTVTQGKTSYAAKGMMHASQIMAQTVGAMLEQPDKIEAAAKEFNHKKGGEAYKCPIPEGVTPSKLN